MKAKMFLCAMVFVSLAGLAWARQEPSPRILAPDAVLRSKPFTIRVEGLKAATVYTLRGEYASRSGTIWRSEMRFAADAKGIIDLDTMAPISGSYTGVDPLGVFWSMENSRERSTDGLTFDNDDYSVLNIIVRDGDKQVAQHYTMLRDREIGVSTVELRGSVTGTYLSPTVQSRKPGVIVLGGSEGGTPRGYAALVASHGFPTLSLGYFGMDGLPNDLERIPVETIDRGVEWLARQPGVDPKRIVVLGMSKGAELALLAAARNLRIHGVIAVAPSSVVFEGISNGQRSLSSWTAVSNDVPFAPYVRSDEYTKSRRLIDLYDPTFDKAPPASVIEVEKIAGPILLISGKSDMLWPSARMADQMAKRLREKGFKYEVTNWQRDDVGHHVARVPLGPTADSVRLGGSARSIAIAQVDAWGQMISFLNKLAR